MIATVTLLLSLSAVPTAQAEPLTLDPALAEVPVEAALTVAALEQLATGEKGRVSYALYQLEGLLALPGFRAAAIDEALEGHGGLKILQDAASATKGKALQELRARLEQQVRERLGAQGATDASAADVVKASYAEQPELPWMDARDGWWRVPLEADRSLEAHLRGCEHARLTLFDAALSRIGETVMVDTFTPANLWGTGPDAQGMLRVEPGAGCVEGWGVALVSRPAPPALATSSRAANLQVGQRYRVRSTGKQPLNFRFPSKAGGVYTVRTFDLTGDSDTRLAVRTPDGLLHGDDDGGDGLASAVRLLSLAGGDAVGSVDLTRADARSTYLIAVDQEFEFEVAPVLELGAEPWTMSGAGWSGHVVPIRLTADEGVIRFQAEPGGVYSFHTDLGVTLTGPEDVSALRLVGEDISPEWAQRPITSFLAVTGGTFEARLTRGSEGPDTAFFQFLAFGEPRPTPRRETLGTSHGQPLPIVAGSEESFDGGLLARVEPGSEGFVAFKVVPDTRYEIHVDGSNPGGALEVELRGAGREGRVFARGGAASPVVRLEPISKAAGTWVLRVANRGDEANEVRVAVIGELSYNGLRVGDRVEVRRHRPYRGVTNWADTMERFVGRNATIMSLAGSDTTGAWVVHLDLDGGEHAWRTRDLGLVRRGD